MPAINENTTLLSNGHLKSNGYSNEIDQEQNQQQPPPQNPLHYIVVLEKPIHNGYEPIPEDDSFSSSLTLEELLPFIDDPWWQKLRHSLFCSFIVIFWLVLLTACALAYMRQYKQCAQLPIITSIPTSTTSTTVIGVLQKS